MAYKPLVIIGAPRSGTNMLRDTLARLQGVATWPCDEINYIWRHGNVRYPSDEFTADMARAPVVRYIRHQFEWVARRYRAHTVLEKTCANSLRVPFVDSIVPEAKYVFIYRDGMDAVGSAMQRWRAGLDIPYLARKARFVPVTDLPYYGSRYLLNWMHRVWSREQRLAFWGPCLNNMPDLLQQYSLEEVCALQWKRCVQASLVAFRSMPEHKFCTVSYEAFVTEPERQLARIVEAMDLEASRTELFSAVADVSARNVGKGRTQLGDNAEERLLPLIGDLQVELGYA